MNAAGHDWSAIRDRHPLLEVAARYVDLKKQGSEYVGLCLFHNDKSPSMHIYRGRDGVQRFRCFSCGANGDVVDFIREVENVDAAEAVRRLDGEQLPMPSTREKRELAPDESDCWEPIVPVPADAPAYDPARTYNPKRGKFVSYRPALTVPYYRPDGGQIGYVVRLEFEDGEKICPVITYCAGPGGEQRWCAKRQKPPYALVGSELLARRPEAAVMLVEGEKKRLAAEKALPAFIVLSLLGGAEAVGANDPMPKDWCTLAVGDGSGRLFVHGHYDAIKICQSALLARNEAAFAPGSRHKSLMAFLRSGDLTDEEQRELHAILAAAPASEAKAEDDVKLAKELQRFYPWAVMTGNGGVAAEMVPAEDGGYVLYNEAATKLAALSNLLNDMRPKPAASEAKGTAIGEWWCERNCDCVGECRQPPVNSAPAYSKSIGGEQAVELHPELRSALSHLLQSTYVAGTRGHGWSNQAIELDDILDALLRRAARVEVTDAMTLRACLAHSPGRSNVTAQDMLFMRAALAAALEPKE